ncbi:MAG: type IX secretion system membrane protein PorP/SprF [Flavobacteriales bacterium]
MKNRFLFSLLILCSSLAVNAQQEAMFTHYMFNTQAVNPAYAGSRDALTVTGLHRSMWVGFKGAPITQTITLHSPIFNNKFGIGLSVLNDKIGPTQFNSIAVDFAYRVKLSKKAKLAFGVKPSMMLRSAQLSSLALDTDGDNAFANNINNQITGNVGAGVYFYTNRFYAGISSPAVLENKLDINSSSSEFAKYQRHYYFITGAMLRMGTNVQFKPTALIKATVKAPVEADLTASFVFNNKFWLGAMYRSGDAIGALLGLQLTEQLAVGYSFDWSYVNNTAKYNSGSHELMLRYDFIFHNEKQIISPRYF